MWEGPLYGKEGTYSIVYSQRVSLSSHKEGGVGGQGGPGRGREGQGSVGGQWEMRGDPGGSRGV